MADSLRPVVKMLIHRLEITRGYLLPGYSEADQDAQAAIAFAEAALAAEPPAPAEPDTDAVLALAAIIRRVDGSNSLGAAALAEAILSHPGVASVLQPPAPAPAIPLDLDALLSPEGAYEPGTGQEDGAQLVDQLQWWAPVHGCETLENLLDRIRGRILPHLRPPIAGIDVPGPDGDYGGLQELCEAEGVDVRIGAPLLKRAWAVWGAAPPPAPAPAADGERAAALLRQPAPAPVPVPVAERPWDRPGWCDAEGRCWLGDPGDGYFIPSWWYRRPGAPSLTVSLPHWAIPQPPQGGEVES